MSLFPVGHASHSDWRAAADAVLLQLRSQMADPGHVQRPRLGLVYLSHAHAAHARPLLQHLARALPHVADWAGCSAGGVLAMSHEYLSGSALAVMLLDVPAAHYRLYSGLAPLHAPGGEAGFTAHSALVHAGGGQPELAELLYELSERTESGLLFGGVGDDGDDGVEGVQIACRTEDLHAQHADARGIFSGGFSGVAFGAGVPCITGMAQGCVPLGEGLEITEARGALVTGLNGDPALQRLLQLLGVELEGSDWQPALTTVRSTLAAIAPPGRGMAHGVLTEEAQVLTLVGLDPLRQGVALSSAVEAGHSVIFCRRQAQVARQELLQLGAALRDAAEPEEAAPEGEAQPRIRGAIYISCRGRGGGLFGGPDAELRTLRHALGDVPLIGFVAEAEIMDARLHRFAGVLTVFTA
ncbi:small ligand-binding sensory domain FIST [Delftia sp. 60]|uniref:FIST signal transduction protein n=1 Tax=Delftia sp. 60 TaxID=2035216 RepID=UPI000C18C4C1|nr:FIST N-terminal domain-containing protein [Delftia sp. 60]PIF34986.1 small ligand-binding sensory domain FIST [Burkholderiales bacterium 23]PIF64231.1 small ligand-binding sensory domain FIST [Delftia sp. 60]